MISNPSVYASAHYGPGAEFTIMKYEGFIHLKSGAADYFFTDTETLMRMRNTITDYLSEQEAAAKLENDK